MVKQGNGGMYRYSIISTTLMLTLLAAANDVQSQDTYRANLNGIQAGSSSTATATAVLCLSGSELIMQIEFDGLTTDQITGFHIRIGEPGVNGPRVFGLVNPQDDLDDFVDLGTGFESIWDDGDNGAPLATQIPALQNGVLHFLAFTEAYPNGEIRGQINPVLMGDLNQDGVKDLNDVAVFVDLLTSGSYLIEGDFDKNGVIDLVDTQPFVNAISNCQ